MNRISECDACLAPRLIEAEMCFDVGYPVLKLLIEIFLEAGR